MQKSTRLYLHPCPSSDTIEDNVTRLLLHTAESLNAGTVRSSTFSVPFKFEVYRYLFGNLTNLFETDFPSNLFPSNWFVVHDKYGNGCSIDFPIKMTRKLKYEPKSFFKARDGTMIAKPRIFTEVICVNLCKKCC